MLVKLVPTAMNDQLFKVYSTTPLIIKHLKALHSAREFFLKAKSSAELKNALKKQTRYTRQRFDLGQAVYCKRNNDIKWNDPGKTVGQDSSVVFIRHGDFYVKVQCSRIQMADSLLDTISQDNNDSQLHSQTFLQQTNKLTMKILDILHQMFMLIVVQEIKNVQLIRKKRPLTI